jgi:uncharacterized protein (TIGR03437 family)
MKHVWDIKRTANALCALGIKRTANALCAGQILKRIANVLCAAQILLAVAAPLAAQVTFNNTPSREFGQSTLALPGPTSNAPNLIEGREFNGPYGIAFDYSQNPPAVYVADTFNNRVLGWHNSAAVAAGTTADIVIGQLNFTSNLVGGPGTSQSTGLFWPVALAVDSKGNLYVTDAGNNRILRFPTPFQQTSPIVTVDLVIGQQTVSSGNYPNAGNSKPSGQTVYFSYSGHLYQSGLALDSSGNLWTTDPLNNRTLRFPAANLAAGTVQPAADMVLGQCDFVSSGGPAAPNNTQTNMNALVTPSALAFDTAGRLYVADAYSRVLEFQPPAANCQAADRILGIALQNPQSQQPYPTQYTLGSASSCGPNCSPQGVFTLGNHLYVCDTPENRVVGYDIYSNWPAPTTTTPSPPEISEIGQPGFTGQPNLTSGQVNANQYQPSNSSLYAPLAGAVNNVTNEIWIVDSGNNRVLVFPAPAYSSASRVLGQLDFPYNAPNLIDGQEVFLVDPLVGVLGGGIVVDKTSNPPHLYIADPGNNRVLGFMNASNVGTDSHSILTQKADLVIGQPNLMSSQPNYSPSNTQLSQAQMPNSTGLSVPTGLAVDSNGNLYVADSVNGRVLRFPQPFSQPAGSLQTANLVLGQSSFTTKIQDPSQSTMNTPYGLALFNGPTGVSNAGGLAVSDVVHNRILIFAKPAGGDFTSGQAASIVLGQQNFTSTSVPATATTASLNGPRHIASDTSDFLYVADTNNNRMVVFANASKSVNGANAALVVSSGAWGALYQPEGIAVSLITGDIWVADTNGNSLLQFPNFQTLLANNQPTNALNNVVGPLALALDTFDNLVVADETNRVNFFFPAMFYRNAANYTSGTPGSCTTSTNLTPGMLALLGRYGESAQDVFSFTAAPTQPLPWPTTGLNGVQVMVDGVAAPVFGLGTTAVYFQVPNETPSSGTADFVVQNPSTGQILAAANFNLQAAAPGIFTVNQAGTGQAAATLSDGSVNSASNQVARGSTITLWLTGSGYIPNIMDGVAPGAAISTPTPPQVFFNAIQATNIQYSGVSPQYPGLWQINVTVPSNVPPGNNVPVLVLGSTSDYASNCVGSNASVGPGPDQVSTSQPTIAVK